MEYKKEKENVVIKNNLDESINLAKEIKKDIEQLNKDLIENDNFIGGNNKLFGTKDSKINFEKSEVVKSEILLGKVAIFLSCL